jgi:hypothetical protein
VLAQSRLFHLAAAAPFAQETTVGAYRKLRVTPYMGEGL